MPYDFFQRYTQGRDTPFGRSKRRQKQTLAPTAGQAGATVDANAQMNPEGLLMATDAFGTMNDRRRQRKNRLGGGLSDQAAAAFLAG